MELERRVGQLSPGYLVLSRERFTAKVAEQDVLDWNWRLSALRQAASAVYGVIAE
jgi:hypothetical protein